MSFFGKSVDTFPDHAPNQPLTASKSNRLEGCFVCLGARYQRPFKLLVELDTRRFHVALETSPPLTALGLCYHHEPLRDLQSDSLPEPPAGQCQHLPTRVFDHRVRRLTTLTGAGRPSVLL
jgi:hypothetical protein